MHKRTTGKRGPWSEGENTILREKTTMVATKRKWFEREEVKILSWIMAVSFFLLMLQPWHVVGISKDEEEGLHASMEDVEKILELAATLEDPPCRGNGFLCDGILHDYLTSRNMNPGITEIRLWTGTAIMNCLTPGSCQTRRKMQDAMDENPNGFEDPDYPDMPFDPFHPWPKGVPAPKIHHPPPVKPMPLTGTIPRLDPMTGLKLYTMGFNVTNPHYWSSVLYTGFWGYMIALMCSTAAISYGALYFYGYIGQQKGSGLQQAGPSRLYLLICMFFFSLLTISADAVIFWGNARLTKELAVTAHTLIGAADEVQYEINHALDLVQLAAMFPISHQGSSHEFLQACFTLARVFNKLQRKVKKNKARVYQVFDSVLAAMIVISASMTLVVALGAVSTMGNWRYVQIGTFGLMAVVLTASWILSGVTFGLTNVANDACKIMREYEADPTNSSVARGLPCLRGPVAVKALGGAKQAIKHLVTQANVAIDWANRQEERMAAKQNTTIAFFLPRVCDPYGAPPLYDDQVCPANETAFAKFGQVYGPYRCSSDNITYCFEQATPVPNFVFLKASMAMNASDIVYRMLPSIFKIVTCVFVKVTFEDILFNHCDPLVKSLNDLWKSFVIASVGLMPVLVSLGVLILGTKEGNRQIIILRRLSSPIHRISYFDSFGSRRGSRPSSPSHSSDHG